jgi:hypothetical protein
MTRVLVSFFNNLLLATAVSCLWFTIVQGVIFFNGLPYSSALTNAYFWGGVGVIASIAGWRALWQSVR